MKRCMLAIVCLVALLAACGPGGDSVCQGKVCLDIAVKGPVKYDEPTVYVLRVTARNDVPDLVVTAYDFGASELLDVIEAPHEATLSVHEGDAHTWHLAAKEGEEYIFTGRLAFPQPKEPAYGASFQLTARAVADGVNAFDYVDVYYDAQGNWVDPAQRRSYTGEDILVPTIHPSITVFIPTPTATFTPPTATPEPTPTVDPYPAPGEGLAAPPEGVERAAPTVAAYPAP